MSIYIRQNQKEPSPDARASFGKARLFYKDLLKALADKYPRLIEDNIGMFKVIHVFDDKIPLVDVLLEQNLLVGMVLKKSSSEMQGDTAQALESRLTAHDLLLKRSQVLYADNAPAISARAKGRKFIIGDHGGYFAHTLTSLTRAFGEQLVGITEHTLNGEERVLHQFRDMNLPISYFSTARIDLKERSDRDIANNIVLEIVRTAENLGKSLFSSTQSNTILLVGYGTMGLHAARMLKDMGCQAELVISDNSLKKVVFAVQDGYEAVSDIESVLPRADIIILATNTIKGKKPVLSAAHFAMMKKSVCISSMTSLEDEVNHEHLIRENIITLTGFEDSTGVYRGPTGKRFFLTQNGRPANVGLSDGGAGNSIYLVEAAGLAGAFAVAQSGQGRRPTETNIADTLSDEDAEIISRIWLRHFYSNMQQQEPQF
ncbi:MAG: hypothetical protein J0L77_05220 [Alphaproteobacteria bacterium]|nr:hypothetical protein [Alphaproteobacteria bacterium]